MKKLALLISIIALTAGFVIAQNTGGIKGQVRTFDGEGISNVEVTARQDGKNIKSVKGDRNGNFVLDGLKAGVYNFVFTREGYGSGLQTDVEVKENKIRDLGDNLLLDVDKGTQVIINGSVFSKDGFIIYGAKIKVEKVLSNGKTKKITTGYSNKQGEFVFRFPNEAAKYRITASAKGKEDTKELEVEEAAIYRLALNLDIERK
jgi:hypothetical protein